MLCKKEFYFHEKCVIKISIIVVSFYACLPPLRRFFIFYNPIIIGLFRCFFQKGIRCDDHFNFNGGVSWRGPKSMIQSSAK